MTKLKKLIAMLLATVAIFTFGIIGLGACDNYDLRAEIADLQREIDYLQNRQNDSDETELKNQLYQIQTDLLAEITSLQNKIIVLQNTVANCDLLEQIEKLQTLMGQLRDDIEQLERKLSAINTNVFLHPDKFAYNIVGRMFHPLASPLPSSNDWNDTTIHVMESYTELNDYIAFYEYLDSEYLGILQNNYSECFFDTHYLVRVLISSNAMQTTSVRIEGVKLNGQISISHTTGPHFVVFNFIVIVELPRIINPNMLSIKLV